MAFLVSGEPHSAMGLRAAEFAKRLASTFSITIFHREGRRGQAIWNFIRQLGHRRPELLCVFDHSLDAVFAAVIHQARLKTPWILDTGDDISALGKALGRRGPSMWTTRWLDRLGINRATHIVVRGRGHQEQLLSKGLSSTWIPDGIDLAKFRDDNIRVAAPSRENPLTIGVLGTSVWSEARQMCYGLDLLEIVKALSNQFDLPFPVRGEMIGDGSGIKHLRERAAELGIADKINFLGRKPTDELPPSITRWHIGLSTQTNDAVGHVRTTGKLPIYLACGRFCIASRVGEAARVLPEEMLVHYVGESDPDYPLRVAKRIDDLIKRQTDFTYRIDARMIAEQYFDYDRLAETYRSVFEQVLQQHSKIG